MLVWGLLAMTTSAAAVDHVYWAGGKIRKAELTGANPTLVRNVSGSDVAVDPVHQKIFWSDPSGSGVIMMANLNGTGTPTALLLTGTWVHELLIDVPNQTLYWDDSMNNRIHWSSIANPLVHTLPLNPLTLRAMALDLRPANRHLYYIDDDQVWRADLNGANPTQLPNSIGFGTVFGGLAVDTCTDHLIATGRGNGPTILRADLSDAGNLTVILQDPTWTAGTVGEDPRKIALDLHNGLMYWTVPADTNNVSGISTIRRANLDGTAMQVLATTLQQDYTGLALDLADTSCPYVGVNKDLQNNTGQIADGIKILIGGSYTALSHYDGYPANRFSKYTETPAAGGTTMLTWSHPNSGVQPGQITHVGLAIPASALNILGVFWIRDEKTIGCAHQVSTHTHSWGSPGARIIYANNTLACQRIKRYVGEMVVEWHAEQVPLADLNPRIHRKPIRTDVIHHPVISLVPGATARVPVPTAPANARFGVIVHKVSGDPKLAGPDVTTDFLEFAVTRSPVRPGPGLRGPAADSDKPDF